MTIKEFRLHLAKIKQRINDELPKLSEQVAVATLSLVKDRSIEEGISIGGNESNKAEYSKKTFPTTRLKGKERNAGGRAYIEANALGNWAGFRQAQGLKSDKVNLSYTNRMWTGIQVLSTTQTGYGKFQSIIGAADQETRDKIEANVERFGMFLDPTPDEIEIGRDSATVVINRLIRDV
ncbi:hypothetical protein DYBT9275_02771 [Dyadobacter sp. CECT 9275]|uniref:Uncharacterized protein n=1 Tax=Dyadobacter helix TaxID=2822344 RepID=A0A916JCD3_9BACT|nr:hypothetical protein [Dyadobacter sp. CECT 9275]CAG5001938.1 hypothetical protein DYBT9275_02771 [Dyadobacter sp. CECT 9275]